MQCNKKEHLDDGNGKNKAKDLEDQRIKARQILEGPQQVEEIKNDALKESEV